jgi:hypothetical protein
MLSKKSLRVLSLGLTIVCFFRVSPFVWNPNTQKLSLHPKRWSRILSYFVSAFVYFHFCFIAFRSFYAYLVLGTSVKSFLFQLTVVSHMGLSVSTNLNTLFKPKEMIEYVNQYLLMDKQLTGM